MWWVYIFLEKYYLFTIVVYLKEVNLKMYYNSIVVYLKEVNLKMYYNLKHLYN